MYGYCPTGNLLWIMTVTLSMFHQYNMKALADAAAYWGKPEGTAKFMPGVGRATDTQAREDIERMAEGLTPYGDTENWRELFNNAR
jgi:hypothetical protein